MLFRSVILTGTSTWRVPSNVSAAWINSVAPGGAGQAHSTAGGGTSVNGGSGGGAGEFCLGLPVPLVPNSIVSLALGTGGIGGNDSVSSTGGTASAFLGFSLLGGGGSPNTSGNAKAGDGGGPGGAIGSGFPTTDGTPGNQESPTAFGGASGGVGEGLSVAHGGAGGQQIGQYASPRTPNTGSHPGGGGGCSVFGAGGLGTSSGPGLSGTGYGTGSSGMSGGQTTESAPNGNGPVLQIFYLQA